MRNISFALTTAQFLDGSKTVTRRLGWKTLQPGTQLCAVEKSQGLGKGGKVRRLGVIDVVSVRRESLMLLTQEECRREGFPHLTPRGFVDMFVEHMGCDPGDAVTRIEFRVVGFEEDPAADVGVEADRGQNPGGA